MSVTSFLLLLAALAAGVSQKALGDDCCCYDTTCSGCFDCITKRSDYGIVTCKNHLYELVGPCDPLREGDTTCDGCNCNTPFGSVEEDCDCFGGS